MGEAQLNKKANDIASNFAAIKAFAFFSSKTVVKKLKAEMSELTVAEVDYVRSLLIRLLSPNDYTLFENYLSRARKSKC